MKKSECREEWLDVVNAFFDGELQTNFTGDWEDWSKSDDAVFNGNLKYYRRKPKRPLSILELAEMMVKGERINGHKICSLNTLGVCLQDGSVWPTWNSPEQILEKFGVGKLDS